MREQMGEIIRLMRADLELTQSLSNPDFTPAQRKAVEAFAKTIDITDSNVVLQYGAAAQKNIAGFPRAPSTPCAPRIWGRSARPCPPWWWS